MKASSKIKCVCGSLTPISYQRPGMFRDTIGVANCSGCESELVYTVQRTNKKGQVKIGLRFKAMSKVCHELLAEQVREKIKDHEAKKENAPG